MASSRAFARLTFADFKPESLRGTVGFVRVGRSRDDRWWLLDAADRPFFSRGVCAVGKTDGKEANADPVAGSPRDEAVSVEERLRSWQVDTLGAGSDPEIAGEGFFETVQLAFRRLLPETSIRLGGALLPDVFNPAWKEACEQHAVTACSPRRDDRRVIGYFTDDELGWAQPGTEPLAAQRRLEPPAPPRQERPSLLQICLSLEPAFPAYHAAWEFALAPHGGDLGALARAWETPLVNKEALRQQTLGDVPLLTQGYLRDNERFSREFAHAYFTTCAAAIHRQDPNHLILGCRFAASPGPAVLAACIYPQVDVLSVNEYRDALFERIDGYARQAAMPVLLAGFSWVSEYFTERRGARERAGLTRVERMLSRGRAALEEAFAHPALVGFAWDRWRDLPGDCPPFGQGLVHIDGCEASEHTELLSHLNARAEKLHFAPAS
jgi:hypothetical protein